jgi:hypothetical protein
MASGSGSELSREPLRKRLRPVSSLATAKAAYLPEVASNGLLLHFGSKTVQVPSQRQYRQCYAELRALNQVLSPGYESSADGDTSEGAPRVRHCIGHMRRASWDSAPSRGGNLLREWLDAVTNGEWLDRVCTYAGASSGSGWRRYGKCRDEEDPRA